MYPLQPWCTLSRIAIVSLMAILTWILQSVNCYHYRVSKVSLHDWFATVYVVIRRLFPSFSEQATIDTVGRGGKSRLARVSTLGAQNNAKPWLRWHINARFTRLRRQPRAKSSPGKLGVHVPRAYHDVRSHVPRYSLQLSSALLLRCL